MEEDFKILVEKVMPLFKEMDPKFYRDFHLECWQGIFSFGGHWAAPDCLPPECNITARRNGKEYCDILLKIYPYFKEFVGKYGYKGQKALYRFCRAVGPYTYVGILTDNKPEYWPPLNMS